MVQLTEQDREDIRWEGLMRLVEDIILGVLDTVLISGKWTNRNIGLVALEKKRQKLEEMRLWFKDYKWSIWLSIYCDHNGYNKRHVKLNFEKIRRNSVKNVNKRIKDKLINEKSI